MGLEQRIEALELARQAGAPEVILIEEHVGDDRVPIYCKSLSNGRQWNREPDETPRQLRDRVLSELRLLPRQTPLFLDQFDMYL